MRASRCDMIPRCGDAQTGRTITRLQSGWMNAQGRCGDNAPMIDFPADCPERELLQALLRAPVDAAAFAAHFALSQDALGRHIEALRQSGIAIVMPRTGEYALAQPLELLDAAAILAQLSARAQAGLASLQVAWQITSTNDALLQQPPPTQGARVLLAEQQTAGRGRRGRHWASPLAANLYLSLDRRFSAGLARLSGLSLVAGIAVAEALRTHTGLDVRLKWPNDLWLAEHKLGGLLVEGGSEPGGAARAVIGVGVNVRMPPLFAPYIEQAWADLAGALGDMPSRNALVAVVLEHLLPALDVFDAQGLTPFLARWQTLDGLAGRNVQVKTAGGDFNAQVVGLAENGGLRVQSENGEQVLHSGEVSVRPENG
ncbi:biotin--[acetyl-CoA-carboxylase] ligase [Lysobacteraceae bacterium NML120232]|nr:biotin--[acetyl-CoA-carboxylase] ligase [Xanthomonadaceae bacterium NML120232]